MFSTLGFSWDSSATSPHALFLSLTMVIYWTGPLFTISLQLGISLFNLAYVNNALIDIAVNTCCGKDSSKEEEEVKLQKEKISKINFKIGSKITTVDSVSGKVAWNEKLWWNKAVATSIHQSIRIEAQHSWLRPGPKPNDQDITIH